MADPHSTTERPFTETERKLIVGFAHEVVTEIPRA